VLAWLTLPWPAPALVAIVAAGLLGWRPKLMIVRPQRPWIASAAKVLVVSVAAVAPLANARTSASPLLIHAHNPSVLILAALVLSAALVNAAGEELLWRGLRYDTCTGSPVWFMLATQAVSFGLSHGHGVPSGLTGVLAAPMTTRRCQMAATRDPVSSRWSAPRDVAISPCSTYASAIRKRPVVGRRSRNDGDELPPFTFTLAHPA
jgi:hypothetical protein